MKTIKWTCQLGPDWQWLSGKQKQIPSDIRSMEGTVTLPPNKDYWYPCVDVVGQGVTTGNTWLCYYKENGVDMVQAISCAQGKWMSEGEPRPSFSSSAKPKDRFRLVAWYIPAEPEMSVHWERPEVTGRHSERREQPLADIARGPSPP
jgi:hypothetical protein